MYSELIFALFSENVRGFSDNLETSPESHQWRQAKTRGYCLFTLLRRVR